MQHRRVLDFGCGAGRVLRHFIENGDPGEYWGCDIDQPSITWMNEALGPSVHGFVCAETPPLPVDERFFGLVYAISVFTHLTTSWSAWLLEMHRILTDDGLLIATFLGEGMAELMEGEPWNEDVIGMRWSAVGRPWNQGGPNTYLSPWWIRAHWGRAFEILDLFPHGGALPIIGDPPGAPPRGHGVVVMRKRPGRFITADLERPEPGEPREATALAAALQRLHDEYYVWRSEGERLKRELEQREAEIASYRACSDSLRNRRSGRLTAPLRYVASLFRRLAAGPVPR